jgi:hypothetical protein
MVEDSGRTGRWWKNRKIVEELWENWKMGDVLADACAPSED